MDLTGLLRRYLDADDVEDAAIETVAQISKEKTFQADETVFREDQPSDYLHIVSSGQITVQYLLPSGKRLTVDTCNEGDFLLWSALVKPYTTEAIGICRVPSTVIAIDGKALRELCEENTHLGYHLMGQMARVIRRRLRAARQQIADQD